MSLFKRFAKKKTHADIIAPLTNIVASLEDHAVKSRQTIDSNNTAIASLANHNNVLGTEASKADASKAKIAALLGD